MNSEVRGAENGKKLAPTSREGAKKQSRKVNGTLALKKSLQGSQTSRSMLVTSGTVRHAHQGRVANREPGTGCTTQHNMLSS